MNEKDFDKLLSLEDEIKEPMKEAVHKQEDRLEAGQNNIGETSVQAADISIAKKLKKTIDRQINKKVYIGIFLSILGVAASLFVISLFMDCCFYNPMEPSKYHEDVDPDQYMEVSDFHFLMEIYTGLHFTGKKYIQVENLSKKEGFASYNMYAKIQDVYEPVSIDGRYNTVFEIKQNRFFIEALSDDVQMTIYISDFYNDSKASDSNDYNYIRDAYDMDEERMEEIEKLPESAVIYATISFDKALSMEDTLTFIRSYPDSRFNWIAMDSDVQFMAGTYDGISLSGVFGYDLTDETEEKYPYLKLMSLSEETTAQQLEQCYLSRLQIMYDNPEFLKVVENESSFYNMGAMRKRTQLENRFAEIEEEGLWSIGLYGEITKEDFLTMVEKGEIKYANIKDAKLSILSK